LKNLIPFVILFLYFLNLCTAQSQTCHELDTIPELKGSVCFTSTAPLNYKSGDTTKIELFVRKFPAVQERKGSIWLIPGGPGESGASLYPLISQFSKLFPNLDIFIPDHRGTGYSSKLCPQEEAIDSSAGMALANDEWGSCFNYMYTHVDYVEAFTITNAAKDLSLLINTYSGSGERYIYGVSYGTQLVLRLLQLETVAFDAVILDSLVPHQEDVAYDLSHRSLVTNNVGLSLLQDLDQRNSNEESLKTQLKAILERAKTDNAFAAELPKQDLAILLGMMLDLPAVRNTIPEIIKGLQADNFEPLQQAIQHVTNFYTDYGAAYPSATNSIPLTQVITASENNLRPEMTKAEVAQESEGLLFKSPLPNLIAENAMPTYTRDAYFGKTPNQMPPTLIINGTLDPKTHLDGAKKHYKLLAERNPSVSFVKVQNSPHFIALFAPQAFNKVVSQFIKEGAIENQTVTEQSLMLD